MAQICDAQNKTNGIQNVRFSCTVEPRDGIELAIEGAHRGALTIGFKSIQDDGFYVHFSEFVDKTVRTSASLSLVENSKMF